MARRSERKPKENQKATIETAMAEYEKLVTAERDIAEAVERDSRTLLSKPNVIGYGVGRKRIRGAEAPELAAVFFVSEKRPEGQLSPRDRLPRSIHVRGEVVPTDVVEAGPALLTALGDPGPNRQTLRPVEMGASIRICPQQANGTVAIGTAGAVVKTRDGGDRYVLSAGHVYTAPLNDVVQPFSGRNRDPPKPPAPPVVNQHVGQVIRLAGGGIDAGLAETTAATPRIVGIGNPQAPRPPVVGLRVQKSGHASGVTASHVLYTNVAGIPAPGGGAFPNVFLVANVSPNQPNPLNMIPAFTLPGDSGALVVAGTPGKKAEFGPDIDAFLRALRALGPLGKTFADTITRALDRAALGLAIANLHLGFSPPGGPPGMTHTVPVTLCQLIQPTLDAFDVDLVTT